jgi:8-oxo-dGTP pyrophosphatase MutT (NUDIX family)
MKNKETVLELVNTYLEKFEKEDHTDLLSYLQTNDQLFSRENFNGHITASAFIIDANRREILLLKHKLYDRYLQPGGHVEGEDASVFEASLREAIEETGITADDLTPVSAMSSLQIPLDIDSHAIPANAKRNEAAHVHHDFRYLFLYNGDRQFIIPASESKDGIWISYSEASQNPLFTLVMSKIEAMNLS